RLGVGPGELMLIGDTRIDALTAQNAGSRFGLVLWGFPRPEALSGLAAELTAQEPEEVSGALLSPAGNDPGSEWTALAEAPALPAPVEVGIPGSLARLEVGAINVLGPFSVPGFTPRHVRVYLPRTYDPEAQNSALYVFDGQNVFDDAPSF